METTRCNPTPSKSYNREIKLRVLEHYMELSLGNAKNHDWLIFKTGLFSSNFQSKKKVAYIQNF